MKKILPGISAAFGVGMFFLAAWALHRQIHGRTLHQMFMSLHEVSTLQIVLAVCLTVLCYAILTGYDLLAARMRLSHVGLAGLMLNAFLCHAFSLNIGFPAFMGGSLRCHFLLRKGVPTGDVARIVSFCVLTFWLGFLTLGGVVFLFFPPPIPEFIHIPAAALRPIGALGLIVVATYIVWGALRKHPIIIGRWMIPVAPVRLTLAQIVISSSEWIIGTAVLFILLPSHPSLSFVHLLGIYFLAQISGLVSQVPGGLGVFDTILLALVPPGIRTSAVLASLLLYRLIFNVLPLAVACVLLLTREIRHRGRRKVAHYV